MICLAFIAKIPANVEPASVANAAENSNSNMKKNFVQTAAAPKIPIVGNNFFGMLNRIEKPVAATAAAIANVKILCSAKSFNEKFIFSISASDCGFIVMKNLTAKTIPIDIEIEINIARNAEFIPLDENLFRMSIVALIIGTPGIKNNAQATIGIHSVFDGKKCIPYAASDAVNAALVITKNSFISNFKSFNCKVFPSIVQIIV